MRKLFGTDGIRAVAGKPPLDAKTVYAIGLALAHSLSNRRACGKTNKAPRVVLGMDTRESSTWIAAAITAGLVDGGATVENAGVITTPAIAFLTAKHGFSAGIVISASHNPWQDNGASGSSAPTATNSPTPLSSPSKKRSSNFSRRHRHPISPASPHQTSTKPTAPSTSASSSRQFLTSRSTAKRSLWTAPTAPPPPSPRSSLRN